GLGLGLRQADERADLRPALCASAFPSSTGRRCGPQRQPLDSDSDRCTTKGGLPHQRQLFLGVLGALGGQYSGEGAELTSDSSSFAVSDASLQSAPTCTAGPNHAPALSRALAASATLPP